MPSLARGGVSPEFYIPVDSQRVAEDTETIGNVIRNVCKMVIHGKNAATSHDITIKLTTCDVLCGDGAEAHVKSKKERKKENHFSINVLYICYI